VIAAAEEWAVSVLSPVVVGVIIVVDVKVAAVLLEPIIMDGT
jgi:hypothetical protein